MVKKVKQILKNQKGLTLVELLAVIVILGIIAAVAVPSIGKIIDNSKKDAHVANAEQLISAARMAVAANEKALWGTAGSTSNDAVNRITMQELVAAGYLEADIEDPDSEGTTAATRAYTTAFVFYNETNKTYSVYIDGSKRDIGTLTNPVLAPELTRVSVS